MAKNNGVLKFQGTIEELTYYKTQDGDLVRTRGGIAKSRIMSDPAFVRTRENMSEFASSAQAGKLLRRAVNEMSLNAKDNRVVSRLAQVMSRIQKADTLSLRGQRNVVNGLATEEGRTLLDGFNFNKHGLLESVLQAPYTVDPTAGAVDIPGFIPGIHLMAPEGATHVSLHAGFTKINFGTGQHITFVSDAVELPLDMSMTDVELVAASLPITEGVTVSLLLVEFFQEVNGVMYPLKSGGFNSLGVVDVLA